MITDDIFLIFAANMNFRCLLELLHQKGSNEFLQSMFFDKNKRNNVNSSKPHFSLYKMEFPGVLAHCSLVDFSTLIYWKSPFAT